MDFPFNPLPQFPHRDRFGFSVLQNSGGTAMLREAFLQSALLVIRLQASHFEGVRHSELGFVERLSRFGNEMQKAEPSIHISLRPSHFCGDGFNRVSLRL